MSFFANCLSKNVLRITKVSYCFAPDNENGLGKMYIVPKRFKCSFARILQFVDMSISKTTLKNFKEVEFRYLLETLYT